MENMLKKQFGSVLRLSEYLKNKVNVLYEEYKTYKTSKEKRAMKTWLYNLNLGTKQKDFCWRIIVGGHDE